MITIKLNALKAAACAVSTDQTRYYLTGVCLEWTPAGAVFVATDGHKLIAARHDWIDGETPERFDPVIIPSTLIKKLKPPKGSFQLATLGAVVSVGGGPRMVTIECGGAAYSEPETGGTFPAWRNVLPRNPPTNAPAQYDPAVISAMRDAMKALTGDKTPVPAIRHNGEDPTIVDLNADANDVDAFGVIMPYRVRRDLIETAPEWTRP